ncbi:MAG: cytochrome C oxidase subunit IV family protein [Candidatus Delongbacteria bacterium]|nr:cytochrome C oxidase subunit IV family protein [Candidatus Cloacimonadota bacterium]MCA9786122.1 cytochrome C oxidase subunit IV family protein [Candidatus Cloacimonadota bacterium]MCB9473725.1 cytochrome C oxidase subunit IV family protein [Candidatus Delongbacteria bacterium]
MSHDTSHEHHEPAPYSTFVLVWIALLALTTITVAGSLLFPGTVGITIAGIVTPVKAFLVMYWFMHLKWESRGLRIMVACAFLLLVILLAGLFGDLLFR